jgi:hypothetical protein
MLYSVLPSGVGVDSSFVHTVGMLSLLLITQTLGLSLPDSIQSFQGYHGNARDYISTLLKPIRYPLTSDVVPMIMVVMMKMVMPNYILGEYLYVE